MATITNDKSLESAVDAILATPASKTTAKGKETGSSGGGTVIDENVLIRGDIIAHSDVVLHGTVEGNISCEN